MKGKISSSLQTGLWLIGIGVLALTDFWWPGIMFLIGLSALLGGSGQGALWMIGIGVIALTDFWWPGMIFLVGLSILLGAATRSWGPEVTPEAEIPTKIPAQPAAPTQDQRSEREPEPANEPPARPQKKLSWLPSRCPHCGGPISAATVEWRDAHGKWVECPYCNSSLRAADFS